MKPLRFIFEAAFRSLRDLFLMEVREKDPCALGNIFARALRQAAREIRAGSVQETVNHVLGEEERRPQALAVCCLGIFQVWKFIERGIEHLRVISGLETSGELRRLVEQLIIPAHATQSCGHRYRLKRRTLHATRERATA
ncbi:MAG TPA: hypothetical protein PLJ47_08595 [Candidatus Hydrogenedentes bacterium]|nr:hypothetical protein [Candidatus Hydrogenedentota bacterium]